MTIERLNKYTTLPVLLDLLNRKKLVLLDPKTWDDKNDSEIILEYARRKGVEKIFVSCFSYGMETIHHWKTYSNGVAGCCIEFDAKALLSIADKIPGVIHRRVIYKKLNIIENQKKIAVNKIPFYKRWPYRCEEEYRIIWEGDTTKNFLEIDIPLEIINKVTISQQMPEPVYKTIKILLKDTNESIEKVNRSTIYENKRWISCFK
jgi:hypothetical protein